MAMHFTSSVCQSLAMALMLASAVVRPSKSSPEDLKCLYKDLCRAVGSGREGQVIDETLDDLSSPDPHLKVDRLWSFRHMRAGVWIWIYRTAVTLFGWYFMVFLCFCLFSEQFKEMSLQKLPLRPSYLAQIRLLSWPVIYMRLGGFSTKEPSAIALKGLLNYKTSSGERAGKSCGRALSMRQSQEPSALRRDQG